VFVEAAMVLGLRMALYERAYLNLGVNNGPMGLCWLNDRTRYITLKMLSDAAPHTTPEYMKFLGFKIGESLPFATRWQQWVWQDDELDVIESAFEAMVNRLQPGSDATALRSAPLDALNRSVPG
jgi:3-polyprenyl-4-hydroxybenzoate decarboxylase